MPGSIAKRGYIKPCLVGEGAFSRVYRVTKEKDGRHYACKVSREKAILAREGKILQNLHHPLFPKWIESWQEGEEAFLVMEYIAGSNVESLLGKRSRISERTVRRIAVSLAEGIAYLHERANPIFYRDFKPANIIICQDGSVKLVDFGCAVRMDEWREGMQVRAGTPGFAAPEQLAGEKPAAAGDIYGYGKVLERMCPGTKQGELFCLIVRCTEEEPCRRPGSLRQCRYLLKGFCSVGAFWSCDIEQYVVEL